MKYRIVPLLVLIEFVNQVPVYLFINLIHPIRSVVGKNGVAAADSIVEGVAK
jgi:hypothetical protein